MWVRNLLSVIAMDLVILATGTVLLITQAEEDTPAFNCYLSGDHICGLDETSNGNLGFVNLFPSSTVEDEVVLPYSEPIRLDNPDGSFVLTCPEYSDFRAVYGSDMPICKPI